MKTYKILVFLALMVVNFPGISQTLEWAPIGAKWHYEKKLAMHPLPKLYNEWTSIGDTTIKGINARVIKRTFGWNVRDLDSVMITYEDSNIVYLYIRNMDQFTVLFDFNKNAGESWIMNASDTCPVTILVDSTGIDTINGNELKTLYVSSQGAYYNGKIIEKIGHTIKPMPDITYHCHGVSSDDHYYNGLRCYEDSNLGLYNTGLAPECDYIFINIEEFSGSKQQIVYPNPFSQQAIIEVSLAGKPVKEAVCKIYDIQGKLVEELKPVEQTHEQLKFLFDNKSLSSGTYFYKVVSNYEVIARGKMVR